MKAGSAVSLACATVLILCHGTEAGGTSASAGPARYVVEHWQREFAELRRQIEETHKAYRQGRDPCEGERILDRQFCILPSDRTPFDVEYRRTLALIDLLDGKHRVTALGGLKNRLLKLGKRIASRPAQSGVPSPAEALRDYCEAAAIRREAAVCTW